MRFEVDISEITILNFVGRLLRITGAEPWVKRSEWLAREERENGHMSDWLHDRFGVEWEIGELISSGQLVRGDGSDGQRARLYEMAAFATGAVNIYEHLSSSARNRFHGQLLDGLKTDKGLLSLQHEVSTVVHLVRSGFDVDLHDLENGGGFDFLAKRDGIEVEVECKMFSADVGRKIHRRLSAKLFKVLEPLLSQTFRFARGGLLVRITLPDRLTPAPSQYEGIKEAIQSAVLSANEFRSEHCTVDVKDFDVAASPFAGGDIETIDGGLVRSFVAALIGHQTTTLMTIFQPGVRVVLAVLESQKPDAVLDGIRRQLRDAAVDQFSGLRC